MHFISIKSSFRTIGLLLIPLEKTTATKPPLYSCASFEKMLNSQIYWPPSNSSETDEVSFSIEHKLKLLVQRLLINSACASTLTNVDELMK